MTLEGESDKEKERLRENTAAGTRFIGRGPRREKVFVGWIVTRVRCSGGEQVEGKKERVKQAEKKEEIARRREREIGYRRSSVKFR